MKEHSYTATIEWTGNNGSGTDHYTHYERSHKIIIEQKPVIEGSSDPAFRGDKTKHNPEELLVSALASCHMLWYLHFCATHQVTVVAYQDEAQGFMTEETNGMGAFKEVILHPVVTVSEEHMLTKAAELHQQAAAYCFIARSVRFKVTHKPIIKLQQPS
ncbi:peroxiredoxin [Taibaiella sp. KBW10]|uniref:OsmC family protein n=1 Tax=Taibaiella sp. KBW10 TaxID=2153357 RepID=UPI000F59B02C|nr:OsmC family protein [Taibaiella sp. KBW10]RQO32185.1 peroxiredoxin [Taibaiella sp. KBW10]